MPLSLRAPPRSSSLTLRSSLRLILPLEGLPGDVANDLPAALDFLDWHSLTPSLFEFLKGFSGGVSQRNITLNKLFSA